MKKVLFFACAAALCLAVASCGNSQPAAEEEVATEVVEEGDGVLVCCFLEDDINKHKDFIERCFEIGVTKVIFYISKHSTI